MRLLKAGFGGVCRSCLAVWGDDMQLMTARCRQPTASHTISQTYRRAVLWRAVQVGDILDRGDQELKLLYMLERLQRQAAAAGGALWVLNGNHETMNVGGNFRYATKGVCAVVRWRFL